MTRPQATAEFAAGCRSALLCKPSKAENATRTSHLFREGNEEKAGEASRNQLKMLSPRDNAWAENRLANSKNCKVNILVPSLQHLGLVKSNPNRNSPCRGLFLHVAAAASESLFHCLNLRTRIFGSQVNLLPGPKPGQKLKVPYAGWLGNLWPSALPHLPLPES